MTRPTHSLDQFLAKILRRSILTREEQEALLSLPYRIEQIPAHVDFVDINERVDQACLIAQGLAARFGQSREGNRQITALHIPGDMADLHAVVAPAPASALQTLTSTTILKIPHDAIRAVAAAYPAVAEALWRECVIDSAILSEWIVNVGRRTAGARLAHLYCEIAYRFRLGEMVQAFTFDLPATQHDLADMLGLTAVHVNRTLRGLQGEGLVLLRRGVVEVLDWGRLVAFGDFDPAYLHLEVQPHAPMTAA